MSPKRKLKNMSDYKEVIDRLDQLIAITKLANKDKLDERKKQISNDEVSKAILELLESGPMDYSTLAEKTVEKIGKKPSNCTIKNI